MIIWGFLKYLKSWGIPKSPWVLNTNMPNENGARNVGGLLSARAAAPPSRTKGTKDEPKRQAESWLLEASCQEHQPIGSMVLVYMLTFGVY